MFLLCIFIIKVPLTIASYHPRLMLCFICYAIKLDKEYFFKVNLQNYVPNYYVFVIHMSYYIFNTPSYL